MKEAGLFPVSCVNDPPMFGTDIGAIYATMARVPSLDVPEVAAMSLRAIDAAWLSDEEKPG
ncbi:hypothetical protein AA13594_1508 [Gluconacetobacter azotocaptans DSM 13594]|nr:hypothetical protein AA13594_1508 [Gluconacetobacter azotocaptans DSM 13594]